jgi:hypothetical protein
VYSLVCGCSCLFFSTYKDDIVFLLIVYSTVLTVDVELENLADGGRDAVLGHTHVRSHLAPRDTVQEQHVTPHLHTSNIFTYLLIF